MPSAASTTHIEHSWSHGGSHTIRDQEAVCSFCGKPWVLLGPLVTHSVWESLSKPRTPYIMTVILRGDSESQVIVASDYGMSTHNWLASICTSFPIHFITLHLLFTPHYAKGPSFYQVQKDKPPNRKLCGCSWLRWKQSQQQAGSPGKLQFTFPSFQSSIDWRWATQSGTMISYTFY